MSIEIWLLGGFEVRRGALPVEGFESKKVRALFAYLLLNRDQRISRDRLTGLLWPEQSDDSARQNLRQAVYNLRSTLAAGDEEEVVLANQQEVRINHKAGLWLDTAEFEAAARSGISGSGEAAMEALTLAGHLYRGDLLAGFYVKNSDPFEDWLVVQRELYRETAAGAARTLMAFHENRADWSNAIRAARTFAEIDPLSEEAHRAVMRFYALSGRRGRALAQYEELKRLLDTQLGVEPAAETVALHRALLSQEAAAKSAVGTVEPSGPYIPLVGRDAALRELDAIWAEVRQGRPQLTLVEGERGVGKTRLMRTYVCRAAGGERVVVLQSRCWEPAAHGFEPIAEAVTSLPLEAGEEGGRFSDSGALRMVAGSIPLIHALRPDLPPAAGEAPQAAPAAALAAFLREMGGGTGSPRRPVPLILLLDDLERAGRATLELLIEVLPLLEGSFWILTSFRSDEVDADHPLANALPRLAAHGGVRRIALGRLDTVAVERVASSLTGGESADLAACLAAGGGLPLALAEGINLLADEGAIAPGEGSWVVRRPLSEVRLPGALPELVLGRMALLPPTSRRLLALAAVIGDRFDIEVLEDADGERRSVLEAAIEILVERWLVRPSLRSWVASRRERDLALWSSGVRRGIFEFAQRSIRAILYHQIDRPRRRLLHQRVAAALERRHAAAPAAIAAQLAHHHVQAGDWQQAVSYLKLAGDRAGQGFDSAAAFQYYDRALRGLEQLERTAARQERARLKELRQQIASARTALSARLAASPAGVRRQRRR
jgi:DNA-binding SARP family transcriptional activator